MAARGKVKASEPKLQKCLCVLLIRYKLVRAGAVACPCCYFALKQRRCLERANCPNPSKVAFVGEIIVTISETNQPRLEYTILTTSPISIR